MNANKAKGTRGRAPSVITSTHRGNRRIGSRRLALTSATFT